MRNGPERKPNMDRPSSADAHSAASNSPDEPQFPTMRGVLTAAEIEALLRPPQNLAALETPPMPQTLAPREPLNFDAPETSDAWRHGQALAARLSMALGTGTGIKAAVSIAAAAEVPRAELLTLLNGKSSAVACLGPSEADIQSLICLPPLLADAIIAKACGARGSTGRIGDGWVLSAIDCALLEQLLEPFGAVFDAGLTVQAIETDVPYVSSLLAATTVTITEYSIEAAGLHTELAVIETSPASQKSARTAEPQGAGALTALMTARLARLSVPLSRLTELKAGSTLLLGLPADQPVELLSGDRDGAPAYEGRMGRKGNKVAIKVSKRLRTFEP
jgi:flagellar motor switch/type III secretory pathway protein FliN